MILYIKILIMLFSVNLLTAQDYKNVLIDVTSINHDIIINLKYKGVDNFTSHVVPGYHDNILLLTEPAAKALINAQHDFNHLGFSIVVFDAYRPQKAVDYFVEWTKRKNDTLTKSMYYPELQKDQLLNQGYIASKSGHSKGSTVDVGLVSLTSGKLIDMGTIFDYFGEDSWTESKTITDIQYKNRQLLKDIMEKHGFLNFKKEWWHFTLKNEPFKNQYFDFDIE